MLSYFKIQFYDSCSRAVLNTFRKNNGPMMKPKVSKIFNPRYMAIKGPSGIITLGITTQKRTRVVFRVQVDFYSAKASTSFLTASTI